MGVLPLQFLPGENATSLGMNGTEVFTIEGLDENITPNSEITVVMIRNDQSMVTFTTQARLNTPIELEYYRNGGVLNTVLKNILKNK
jgi:aconitate hydratase